MNSQNIRSILNIFFMILTIAAIIMYFIELKNQTLFIYVCCAAIAVKIAELFIRFTGRFIDKEKKS